MILSIFFVCFLVFLSSTFVVSQPAYASLSRFGPDCDSDVYPYKSCAYPLNMKVLSPDNLQGTLGYGPFVNTPSFKWEGTRTFRLLIPNRLEPGFGILNNAGNIMGCGKVNASAPYLGVDYPAFTYSTADDGTPFAGNALLLSRTTSCLLSVRQYLAKSLGVAFIVMAGAVAPTYPNLFHQPLPNNLGDNANPDAVPAIGIAHTDGQFLINQLINNPTMNLTIAVKGAGRVSAATRTALETLSVGIAQTTTTTAINPELRSWKDIPNQSLDPCWNTVQGLWCELGEPVAFSFQPGAYTFGGTLNDAAFSSLTSLKLFWTSTLATFKGAFPSSWCGNSAFQLSFIRIASQQFTSFPDCWDSVNSPKLQWLITDGNAFTSYPMTAFRAPYMILLSLNSMKATATSATLPTSLQSLSYLNYFDISNNNFAGTLPSVYNMSGLTNFIAGGNPLLTGAIDANQFNFLSSLTVFQIGGCNADGFLPNLLNSTQFLTTVDFSSNKFTGGIPSTWSAQWLGTLTALPLSRNRLSRQLDSNALSRLQFATKLLRLDLSYNLISNLPDLSPFQLINAQLVSSTSTVPVVDLSNNLLAGNCPTGILANLPLSITTINFGSNKISSIPGDMNVPRILQNVNFSSNLITGYTSDASLTSPVVKGLPNVNAALRNLDITNNPLVVTGTISYLTFDTVTLTKPATSVYSCFSIVGNSAFPLLSVKVDPGFFAFSNCVCDSGYFGTPPNCFSIPVANSNITTSVPSLNPSVTKPLNNTAIAVAPLSFSDGWYGSSRALSGIDTVWEVDLSNYAISSVDNQYVTKLSANSLPIRVTYIDFFCNPALFDDASDRISVYQGDRSLSGGLVKVLTGFNSLPILPKSSSIYTSLDNTTKSIVGAFSTISYISVPVLGDRASINFQSRAVKGVHFYAKYSSSNICPDTYELDDQQMGCVLIKSEHQVSYGLRVAIFALSGFIAFLVFFVMIVCLINRDTTIIKASSRLFTGISLISLFWLAGTASLYAVVPSSSGDSICKARLWCSCLSLMTVLGVLVAKSFRVSVIFGSKILLQIRGVTDAYVATIVGLLFLGQVIMLIIFQSLDMSWARYGTTGSNRVWECATGNGFDGWMGAQIGIFASVMIAGAVVAFRTRSVPSAFNESSHILFSLQILLIFMLLLVPLDWALLENSPDAAVIIQGGGQLLLAFFLLMSNFIPKLYYIFTKRGNDKSLVFQNTGSKMSGGLSENRSSTGEKSSLGNDSTGGGTELSSRNSKESDQL